MEYYSAIKNKIKAFTGKLKLENIMLSEIGQAQKNQWLNVFSDKWMKIYNKGVHGLEEKNEGTLGDVEENWVGDGKIVE